MELHKEIIDILGDEASALTESKYEAHTEGLGTLCTISLACKAWHSFAIQHIFRMIQLTTNWRERQTYDLNGGNGRVECFLALIQANPDIARYVRYVHLELPYFDQLEEHAFIEKVCTVIKPITSLKLNFNSFHESIGGDPSLQPHPHLFNAVHSLTGSPEFRELVLVSQCFHTSFLQDSPKLECLNLNNVPGNVVVDSPAPYLARPKKFVQWLDPIELISQLKKNPDVHAIFSEIEDLDTAIGVGEPFMWGEVLDLGRLTRLSLLFCVLYPDGGAYSCQQCKKPIGLTRQFLGWGASFFSLFRNSIPWKALSNLVHLSVRVYADEVQLATPDHDPHDTSDLILAGPSRLPRLSSLEINVHLGDVIFSKGDVPRLLEKIYRNPLGRTFTERDSFPALRIFQTELKLTTWLLQAADEREMTQLVKEQLPSVFGPGGRGELRGFQANPRVKVVEDRCGGPSGDEDRE